LIVTMAMGIRHGFGLWMQPMTQDHGLGPRRLSPWPSRFRTSAWGLVGIFSGMLADRFGAFRVIVAGGSAATRRGCWGMAHATTPLALDA
jgi:hypothetical protein